MGAAAVVAVMAGLVAGAGPAVATPGPADAPEYWFDSWQIDSLWNSGIRGQGVTIAEIDTGVSADPPELRGRILPGTDLGAGGNGHIDREVDGFGHGTAMASIMVARPGLFGITGLAPDAKILPIAVPLNGTTDAGRPDDLAQAIRYAVNHHAKIVNMSLGGKRSPHVDSEPCSTDEQRAVYYALRKGAIVIASVGNAGPTKNTVEDPGVCLGVVSVGAVDVSGTVASFSSREPYLTLVAPGVDIPSLGRVAGQAYKGNGTSQATAIASAVAALVWSRYPKLSARAVLARILATLDSRRATPSPSYGYGLLDAYRAVTASVPADAPDPVYDLATPFMKRDVRLGHGAGRAPKPVALRAAPLGTYAVGSRSRVTMQVLVGIVLAAIGLLLLVALGAVGLRGRGRRRPPDQQTVFVPYEPIPSVDQPSGRPHPRPRPGPGPSSGPETRFHT